MNIKILKSGIWAQSSPGDPQFNIKEGQERDDIPLELCQRLIKKGAAEEVEEESDDLLDLSVPKIKEALPALSADELNDLLVRENAGKARKGVEDAILAVLVPLENLAFLAGSLEDIKAGLEVTNLDALIELRKLEDNGAGREDVIEALKAAIAEKQG